LIYINRNREIDVIEWRKIIDMLGLWEKLTKAKTIVIKPNLAAGTYVAPKTHVISDMNLLKSVIEFCYKENPKSMIYIAESDSTGYGFAFLKFQHLNLPACLNLSPEIENHVKLLDMTRDQLKKVEDERLIMYTTVDRQLWLSETLLNSDFTVSLSNLKTHAVTGYTGACKNLFGCLPDFDKSVNHPRIHKVIHDLVLAIHPDLNIVDGFYGMERNGPVQGISIDSGYRVFSNDAVDADAYAAATIGYPPGKVGYLKKLAKTLGKQIPNRAETVRKYKKAGGFLRVMNSIGLFIQWFGQGIANFGHRIHSCPTPFVLVITIARPILLRFIDYEKLKLWKRKFFK